MYQASTAFHQAVANGAHQIPLLIFQDAVFSSADINVSDGIEFNDYFCTETDLSIGLALSNELVFTLFNDAGLLNDYEFGDFLATIGAQIGNSTVTANGTVQANSGSHTWVAYSSSPYLKRDGTAVASQPTSQVVSMLIYNDIVYCYLANGSTKCYKDSTGTYQSSITVNDFMLSQFQRWTGKGINYKNRILKIWQGTNLRTYEFVPLGYFTAERPNVPSVIEIHFTCYDYMQKFEVDMPSASDLGITYPITIGNLYAAMCNYVHVPYRSSTFINSTAVITKHLDEFENVTMREVLSWIAEAAGSNARVDRDGYMVMDWMRDTEQSFNESKYREFNPYWYETRRVGAVCNRASSGEYDNTVGIIGSETYLIQDNPLLKGVS